MNELPHILYLSGKLPTRSETFVYREIFGLRNRGVKISTASVHRPERDLGEACLESLANQTVPIYGRGIVALICDASLSALSSPWRAASVLVQAISDSVFGSGVKLAKRPRLIIQCVGSLALAWRLRKYGIDHIHAHMAHVPATIAMYAAKFMDVTWSFTGHAIDIFQEQTLLNQKLKRSSFAVCISYWHQSFYRNRVEISDYRLPVIRCGIDVDSFVPGVGGGGIISVGRLVEKKGFDVLIRAMARLKRRGQDIDTTIVGEGPDLVALDNLRSELNVDVQLLGAKSNEEVQHLLRESSLFVLPSRISRCGDRDGIPVVLMEAMASGCCVVGGDLPAIRELVNNGQTGVLVDPDNPDQLAEVIGRLWSDPQKRKRLADRGRARVIDEFAIEPNLDRLQKAFAGATGTQFISDAGQVSGTRRYCLISPCRDEAQYVRRTLESITSQTVRPALWVIVDDGSTDQTPSILDEFERQFDFIRVVRREDRGRRSVGPGVIDAFYAGLETVDLESFDFVGKVDLDLELPTRYFQVLMERMDANPRIGTCSGKPYYLATHGGSSHDRSRLIHEGCGDEMSVGMTKFYRVICFRQIGGFVRQVMWDGIDCHRCRMLGWIACSFNDPDLRFVHLRPMGASDRSILRGRLRHGYGQYFMGTHLAYMTASALFRMAHRPWVIGGLAMWWGYFISLMQCRPRYDDSAFRAFLRRYQWSCLVHGKARAIRRIKKCRA